MKATTTLILGGGFGGIATANTLRQLLPAEHKIVLIEKTATFHLGTTLTWLMLGERTPEQVSQSRKALRQRGIEVVQTEVLGIEPAKRKVVTGQGTFQGDYLVLALGADLKMEQIEGLDQAAHTFYTMEGAIKLRDALREFKGGEVVLLIAGVPFKCPPAPYEAAMLLHDFFQKRGLRQQVRLSLYTAELTPMATAGPEMGQLIRAELDKRGIAFYPQKRVKSANAQRRLLSFEDGTEVPYDLLIAIPPHGAPRVVKESELTDQTGWVPVEPKTLEVRSAGDSECFYAIGDVTTVPLPGRFQPGVPLMLPKAGVFAEAQGKVVAAQIAAQLLGKEPTELFNGEGFCYIEMGGGIAMKAEGHFFNLPHPRMSLRPPDQAQAQEKRAWVDNWLKANL